MAKWRGAAYGVVGRPSTAGMRHRVEMPQLSIQVATRHVCERCTRHRRSCRGVGRRILQLCEADAGEGFSSLELMATLSGARCTSPTALSPSRRWWTTVAAFPCRSSEWAWRSTSDRAAVVAATQVALRNGACRPRSQISLPSSHQHQTRMQTDTRILTGRYGAGEICVSWNERLSFDCLHKLR